MNPINMSHLSTLWKNLSWHQFQFYYFLSETPGLKWLCPVFCFFDRLMHLACRLGRVMGRFCRWMYRAFVRYYPRMIRGSVRFIFGYTLLIYACNNTDIVSNIPMLEELLQNADWLYKIASEFMTINLRFARMLFEKFYQHAIESDAQFITEFDKCVEHFFTVFEAY